jgi:hypothetical protein
MPHTGHFTHKKEIGCALYRRLNEPHAQSLVADRLLYTPWTNEWTEKSTIRVNTIHWGFYPQHWYELLCLSFRLSVYLSVSSRFEYELTTFFSCVDSVVCSQSALQFTLCQLSKHSQTKLYLLDPLHESPVFSSVLTVFIQTPEAHIIFYSPA